MKTSKVARRYAKALIALTDERGDAEQVRGQLAKLDQTLASISGALDFLSNPTVAVEPRKASLEQLLVASDAGVTTGNLARLLLDKGRFSELSAIRAEFESMLDARSGKATADVTSAAPLSTGDLERLRVALHRLLHKDVAVTTAVDPSLIGGLVVRVGNRVYDASVSNHLARLRHQLIAD